MGGTTLLRSAGSDEDGGNQANIAASGSEQSNTAQLPKLGPQDHPQLDRLSTLKLGRCHVPACAQCLAS